MRLQRSVPGRMESHERAPIERRFLGQRLVLNQVSTSRESAVVDEHRKVSVPCYSSRIAPSVQHYFGCTERFIILSLRYQGVFATDRRSNSLGHMSFHCTCPTRSMASAVLYQRQSIIPLVVVKPTPVLRGQQETTLQAQVSCRGYMIKWSNTTRPNSS